MNIQTKRAKYKIIGDLGILVNEELEGEFSHLVPSRIKEEDAIKALTKELSNTEIVESLQGCSNMALVTTEDCNFRCKYCIYSGKYPDERVHGNKKMSTDTAKKAVDFFFRLIARKKRNSKRKIFFIGFYGGESLLEFQLVKNVIEYAETEARKTGLNNIFDMRFRLNTNGYLLHDRVVDFLMEKDVLLDISLDGPELEHDRFRVTREGHKTWATIIGNLKKMKQRYPDYYNRKVNFLATIHPLHNSHEVERFFLETPELFEDKIPRINLFSLLGLNREEAAAYSNIKLEPGPIYSEKVYQDLYEMFKIKKRENGIGLTGTCFPGRAKLLVTPEGSINICEKINQFAGKIGNLDEGFDFDNIRHILKEYGKGIIKTKCWDCQLWFLCDMCIGKSFEGGQFKFDCTVEQIYPRIIKDFIEKKEEEDNRKYSMNGNSIIDFIEQL